MWALVGGGEILGGIYAWLFFCIKLGLHKQDGSCIWKPPMGKGTWGMWCRERPGWWQGPCPAHRGAKGHLPRDACLLGLSHSPARPWCLGVKDRVPCRLGPGMEAAHSKPSLPHLLTLSPFSFFFNPAWLRNVIEEKKKKSGGDSEAKAPFRSLYLCKGNHLHVCGDARVCLQLGRRGRAREECGESGRAAGGRAPAEPPSCCCINLLKEPLLCGGSTHRVLVWWRRPDLRPDYTTNWSGKWNQMV